MNKQVSSLTNEQLNTQEVFWTWISKSVRNMVADLAQKALELVRDSFLDAGWNQRNVNRRGYRNGYYRRQLTTSHGVVNLKVPRCREGTLDTTAVFERYQRRVKDVERILRHAYLLGCATRGLSQLAEQIFGGCLSHQSISVLMRWTDDALKAWRKQQIEPLYTVVYIDGMHVNRIESDRTVMLATGIREDGVMEVLGFCVGPGESCGELLTDLRQRGLENVKLFVSDDSKAIRSALEWVYPEVAWQSCTFHRLSNLRLAVGQQDFRDKMVAEASCIFRCPSREAALDVAAEWRRRWESLSPWPVYQFMEGLTDSLNFYNLPMWRWKRARTNNPMERLIKTLRQRLRPMGCFYDDSAIERAVFGQLLRWHKIKLTHNT
jgi:transposase-like protein